MRCAVGLGLLLLCWAGGMERADAQPLDGATARLTDAQLDAQRGGFVISGVDVRLGVEMRTYVGGTLALQTNVSWDGQDMNVERSASSILTAATGGLFLANQGRTALLQRVDGSLQTIILNSASNVALRQEIDARLELGGFAPYQTGLLESKLGATLGEMVGHYGR